MTDLLGLPTLASKHGADVDKLILYVHWLMVALFIGWFAYFIYAIFRFRQSRNPKANYVGVTNHSSNYIEGIVIVAEAFLLLGLAVPLWAQAVDDFPDEKDSTVVRIIGRQFYWTAHYSGPDGVFGKQDRRLVTGTNPLGLLARNPDTKSQDPKGGDDVVLDSNEVAVPVNRPVIAHVSTLDVIHSFKVVPLRVCQDAISGMSIPIHFTPTRTNHYQITCAQLCGQGHYKMKGSFKVFLPGDFDTWLKSKSAGASATPVSYE